MRDEKQQLKAVRYIENNPVKAKLCCRTRRMALQQRAFFAILKREN